MSTCLFSTNFPGVLKDIAVALTMTHLVAKVKIWLITDNNITMRQWAIRQVAHSGQCKPKLVGHIYLLLVNKLQSFFLLVLVTDLLCTYEVPYLVLSYFTSYSTIMHRFLRFLFKIYISRYTIIENVCCVCVSTTTTEEKTQTEYGVWSMD